MIKNRFLRTNLVKNNSSIIDVINCLNKSNEKICIVENMKNKVCGIIHRWRYKKNIIKIKKFRM